MSGIIQLFVDVITRLHGRFMGLNDKFGWALSDKWLHFLVIGLFGLLMLIIIQPLFKWFATHDGVLFITFTYVFTVILVVTFGIEIGQAFSGTGEMDFYDIASGVGGFFIFFGVYLLGYLINKRYKIFQAIDKKIDKKINH